MSSFSFSLKAGINNTDNPSADGVFSYGEYTSLGAFSLFTAYQYTDGSPYTVGDPFNIALPLVWKNPSGNQEPHLGFENLAGNYQVTPQPFPTFGIYLHPAYSGTFPHAFPDVRRDVGVRVVIPHSLSGVITTTAQRATDSGCGDETGIRILKNGVEILARQALVPAASPITNVTSDTFVTADILDFIVDAGSAYSDACDDTALEVQLDLSYTKIPTPSIFTAVNCETTQIDGQVVFVAIGTLAKLYDGATLLATTSIFIEGYLGIFSFTGLNLESYLESDTLTVILTKSGDTDSDPATITFLAGDCVDVGALNDVNEVSAGGTITGDVSTNDNQCEGVTTYEILVNATQGTFTLNPNGTYTYVADEDAEGVDVITYNMLCDAVVVNSSTLTITILVFTINARNDVIYAKPNTTVFGNVALNDSGCPFDEATYEVTTLPEKGTITINPNGTYSYVADANATGRDYAEYNLLCNSVVIDTARITIIIEDTPIFVASNSNCSLFKLTDTSGNLIFEGDYQFSNEVLDLLDNTKYLLHIAPSFPMSVDLYLNGRLEKSKELYGKGCISFKTGYSESFDLVIHRL